MGRNAPHGVCGAAESKVTETPAGRDGVDAETTAKARADVVAKACRERATPTDRTRSPAYLIVFPGDFVMAPLGGSDAFLAIGAP